VPSWQTTVVPELGGTTTVVVDFGGGGLLLLMQADSSGKAHSAINNGFMDQSLGKLSDLIFADRLAWLL